MYLELTTKQMAKLLGSSGGKATRKKYGTEHYRKMAYLAAEAKRKKKNTPDIWYSKH